jgi:hypothetical protein
MDTMNRCLCSWSCCLCDWVGSMGESGALRREGCGAGRGYSDVPMW